ncbi:MAG: acyl-CoA thioesterase, partial [Chlamydiales bacterium]
LMPIVHAEGDYFAPLQVDDEIEIFPTLSRIGTTSFTISARFVKASQDVGKVSIVHVVIDKRSKRPLPIPEELRLILNKLPQHQTASL